MKNIFAGLKNAIAKPQASASSNNAEAGPKEWKGGEDAEKLAAQVKQGDLTGLREYLARSRQERDWQDRYFMLDLVIPRLRLEVLNFLAEAEPEAADLAMLRCVYFTNRAWAMRGHGTCEDVQEGGFQAAAECVQAAMQALDKASRLDPEDPTGPAHMLRGMLIFTELVPAAQGCFARISQIAPSHVPAHCTLVNAISQRWYGSHEKSLEFARKALRDAPQGSDMAICVFRAHSLVRTHYRDFDKDQEKAQKYWIGKEVRDELASAFDRWTQAGYQPRRSSISYLHEAAEWFYRVRDHSRLKKALELTGDTYSSQPWGAKGKAAYQDAVEFVSKPSPEERYAADPAGEVLKFIEQAENDRKKARWQEALVGVLGALTAARSAPPELERILTGLGMLQLSLFHKKQGRAEDAAKVKTQALEKLDGAEESAPSKASQAIAKAFTEMGEYCRAIGYWDQAIRADDREADPVTVAGMMFGLGQSYCHIGLPDHGAVALRAALRIYRSYPGDPRIANTLISLGNSLRKSSPAEAEAAYNEASEIRMAKLQYDSATVAWINLGVLCAEQGRLEEALQHYEKALRVRQQTPGTAPLQIGLAMGNIGGVYRRMGRYKEAHKQIDNAFAFFKSDEPLLATVYGMKGEIYFDSGDDAEAVEWFRRSRVEQAKQESPNLQIKIEYLEKEIAALERMGREADAAAAREQLDRARSEMNAVQQSDTSLLDQRIDTEDAVQVEIVFGSKERNPNGRVEIGKLVGRLAKSVSAQAAGRYAGWVGIHESTTLFFYGPDAEKLFASIEPLLNEEPLCAGARVAIQSKGTQREVGVRNKSQKVN